MNESSSKPHDTGSGIGSAWIRNEWDDWNFESNDATSFDATSIAENVVNGSTHSSSPASSSNPIYASSMNFPSSHAPIHSSNSSMPVAYSPMMIPPQTTIHNWMPMSTPPTGLMVPLNVNVGMSMLAHPGSLYQPYPSYSHSRPPPSHLNLNSTTSQNTTINTTTPTSLTSRNNKLLAKKPGDVQPSESLQKILMEEEERKRKRSERSRDSARDTRKKRMDYVAGLEIAVKSLQASRGALLHYVWGHCPRETDDPREAKAEAENHPSAQMFRHVMETELTFSIRHSTQVVSHIEQKRIEQNLLCCGKDRQDRAQGHFQSIALHLEACQQTLMQLLLVIESQEIHEMLQLTPEQLGRLQEQRDQCQEQAHKFAIMMKFFQVLRCKGLDFVHDVPALDAFMTKVLDPTQFFALLKWTESVRRHIYIC